VKADGFEKTKFFHLDTACYVEEIAESKGASKKALNELLIVKIQAKMIIDHFKGFTSLLPALGAAHSRVAVYDFWIYLRFI
jgi:hypothetical protein